ncbi:hypothetical protein AVEN_246007-1 [Araneus ventricosus]|uniref:Uncharacterized protein n=1 Tax=Araneus ventricosus TaxID=182803 RepID=A0A4Y2FEY6_ARAVE|nr:hypothetical protein AVEN_246007-1 [Araneus ventricosus]
MPSHLDHPDSSFFIQISLIAILVHMTYDFEPTTFFAPYDEASGLVSFSFCNESFSLFPKFVYESNPLVPRIRMTFELHEQSLFVYSPVFDLTIIAFIHHTWPPRSAFCFIYASNR